MADIAKENVIIFVNVSKDNDVSLTKTKIIIGIIYSEILVMHLVIFHPEIILITKERMIEKTRKNCSASNLFAKKNFTNKRARTKILIIVIIGKPAIEIKDNDG